MTVDDLTGDGRVWLALVLALSLVSAHWSCQSLFALQYYVNPRKSKTTTTIIRLADDWENPYIATLATVLVSDVLYALAAIAIRFTSLENNTFPPIAHSEAWCQLSGFFSLWALLGPSNGWLMALALSFGKSVSVVTMEAAPQPPRLLYIIRWALGVFGLLLPLLVAADRVFQPWGLYCVAVPYSAVAVWLPALLLLLFGLVAQAFLYQHYWPLLQFARKAAKAQAEQAAALDDNLGPRTVYAPSRYSFAPSGELAKVLMARAAQDKNGRRLSMTPRLFRQTEELKRLSAFGQHAFWMSCSFYVLRLPLVLTLIGVLDAGKPDRAGLSAAQYVIQILAISSSMVNAWLVARVLHRVRDLALSPPPKPEVSLPPPLAAAVARPGSRLNQRRQSGGWSYYPTHAYGSEDHMHMGVQPEPEPPAAKAEQQARKSTSQKQEPVKKRISGYMTNFAKRTRRSLSLPGLLEARESVNEQEDNSSWGLSQP